MGCGCSTTYVKELDKFQRREKEASPIPLHDEAALEKTVLIMVGPSVLTFDAQSPKIIFMFGGPGSMKGSMTNALLSTFDFVLLTAEDIAFTCLPKKLGNSEQSTSELLELLKVDQGILTLDWILFLIAAKLSTSMHKLYLLDLIPSLNALLNSASFHREDAVKDELKRFESRYPALFAINLACKETDGFKNMPSHFLQPAPAVNGNSGAKHSDNLTNDGAGGSKDEIVVGQPSEEPPDEEKAKPAVSYSAEADVSRTVKRRLLYYERSLPYLKYFSGCGRLVEVSMSEDRYWIARRQLTRFLIQMGLNPKGDEEKTLILFTTEEKRLEHMPDTYNVNILRVSDFERINDMKPEVVIHKVHELVEYEVQNFGLHNHVVLLDAKTLDNFKSMRKTVFLEVVHAELRDLIKPTLSSRSDQRPLQVITIAAATVVLLFPEEFPTDLCQRIASTYISQSKPALA